MTARFQALKAAGSSPLARGLRMTEEESSYHARIIPARAGFTTPGGRRPPAS